MNIKKFLFVFMGFLMVNSFVTAGPAGPYDLYSTVGNVKAALIEKTTGLFSVPENSLETGGGDDSFNQLVENSLRILKELLYNIFLAIVLCYSYTLIIHRRLVKSRIGNLFFLGFLFCFVAIISMFFPIKIMEGIVIDTRVVITAMAGLFGGLIPGIVALTGASFYRLSMGGIGALPGIGAIVLGGIIGIWFHFFLKKKQTYSLFHFIIMGFLLAVQGLAWTFVLPWSVAVPVILRLLIPVLLYYPFASSILGTLISYEIKHYESEINLKKSKDNLNKLNEKLMVINKEQEQIIAASFHELRSPLVNIEGFSEELVSYLHEIVQMENKSLQKKSNDQVVQSLEQEMTTAVDYIKNNVRKMSLLINGFQEFLQIDRKKISFESLDLESLLPKITHTIEARLKREHVQFEIGPLPRFKGDAALIVTLFSYLLDNVINFFNSGTQGVIRLSGKNEGGRVYFYISNNGIGISGKEKVFKALFFDSPNYSGGLQIGVNIVKKILQKLDGEIHIKDIENEGVRICIILPGITPR